MNRLSASGLRCRQKIRWNLLQAAVGLSTIMAGLHGRSSIIGTSVVCAASRPVRKARVRWPYGRRRDGAEGGFDMITTVHLTRVGFVALAAAISLAPLVRVLLG